MPAVWHENKGNLAMRAPMAYGVLRQRHVVALQLSVRSLCCGFFCAPKVPVMVLSWGGILGGKTAAAKAQEHFFRAVYGEWAFSEVRWSARRESPGRRLFCPACGGFGIQ